jgi:outer membrane protein assembly factor BamB
MWFLQGFLLFLAADPQTWLQWGGPARDFHLPAAKLADSWGPSGPKQLWKRALGDGYSSVVTDGQTIYTTYKRNSSGTVVIAMEAAAGKTIWEQFFDATPTEAEKKDIDLVHGNAPASTPVIAGDRLFVVTYFGQLTAFERASGRVIWQEDLWHKHGGNFIEYGYSNSPLLYRDTLILPVGGKGNALMAFRLRDGSVAWKSGDSENAMSSPMLINVDGQEQVVCIMLKEVLGANPVTGEILWRHPHTNKTDTNVTSPLWCPGNILLLSSAYDSGTRAIKLTRDHDQTTVAELWFNKKIRVHHTNMMQIGDTAYASSGDFGPAPLTAFKISTGEIVWQQRVFAKANFLHVGNEVIVLDEEGKLSLATFSPEGVKVTAESQRLANPAWTPPTLAGTKLYLRDRAHIEALDLGM